MEKEDIVDFLLKSLDIRGHKVLNYKQLHYFWNVANEGGIYPAATQLNVTPQTISSQVRELEKHLGIDLFRKSGGRLVPTEAGRMALAHAEEIFQIGNELETTVRECQEVALLFRVGIVDTLPESIARRLLAPGLDLGQPVRLVCQVGSPDMLFGELAMHKLDLVLSDHPLPRDVGVKGNTHLLGDSAIAFCAAPGLVDSAEEFPRILKEIPLLLPGRGAPLRGAIDRCLLEHRIQPHIVGEFNDPALLYGFGRDKMGVFPVPAIVSEEVCERYGVVKVGEMGRGALRYYAVSMRRRLKHPAVVKMIQGRDKYPFQEREEKTPVTRLSA